VAYVVSAANGEFLFRHSLTQNDAFTYRVWADNTAIHAPLDGPQGNGATPHPTGLPSFYQPAFIPPVLQTLQNGPISTNDPWLPPSATQTVGNNVDAYADLASPDGFSAGDLRASTTAPHAFDRIYDTSLDPQANTSQTMASVTQLFYTTNFLHDWFYDAGFNEAAYNAQTSNYWPRRRRRGRAESRSAGLLEDQQRGHVGPRRRREPAHADVPILAFRRRQPDRQLAGPDRRSKDVRRIQLQSLDVQCHRGRRAHQQRHVHRQRNVDTRERARP
jgi:hypothetical protein